MNSQSILPASCTSSCLMLMIWSSRARNRSADPVISCFFGRIAPSDAATESCFSIRGNRENEIASYQVSDTETLQSQVNKAGKKRLSLSGLEILHGRLLSENFIGVVFTSCSHVLAKVSSSKSARWRQELFGTIVQRLNLKHEPHHTIPKLCILGFESLK